jgi:hypothetical protein
MPSNDEIIPVPFLNRTELISTVPHMAQSIEKLLNRDVPIPVPGIDMNWLELELELIWFDWNWELALTRIGWDWTIQK